MVREAIKADTDNEVRDTAKEFRERFPEQTAGMSDEAIHEVVMSTDDDMEDEAWRDLFEQERINLKSA